MSRTIVEPYVFTGLDLTINADVVLSTVHMVGVCVEFTYSPGEAPRLAGAPEDCDDGYPDELDITAVKLADGHTFGAPGLVLTAGQLFDILPLLSEDQVEAIAENLLKRKSRN